MKFSKLTVVTGHYGSGKTNFSVNLAMSIAAAGHKCTVIDLDIVNPYFRTADFEELFSKNGITLKTPLYANSNLDIPALNIPLDSILNGGDYVIIDVGGDDEGAKALGRYQKIISDFSDKEMLYVINKYRYLTREASEALELMHEIENASGLKCTGIVNNSNLGFSTEQETVRSSLDFADAVCREAGLPLFCNVCCEAAYSDDIPSAYRSEIYVRSPWNNEL